jgi:hypothetical protein
MDILRCAQGDNGRLGRREALGVTIRIEGVGVGLG